MKKIKSVVVITLLIGAGPCFAQDPSFSQFFSSPLNINPALTANINADWRVISNLRDQWIGPASPYISGTVSFDRKILQHKVANTPENDNTVGVGAMIMYDYAMSGIQKSVYASLNMSYNVLLAEGDQAKHRLGAGFGFNTNLPTGESALSNMKPHFSGNAGITYSFTTEKSNLDIGVAAFHFNRPKQTFLEDPNQYLAMRKVVHGNFETFINERTVLNINAVYQQQSSAHYYQAGGALGYFLNDQADVLLNAGVWYWSSNAIVPYVGFTYNNMQFGFSYDATISKLNRADRKPNTFEMSIILRGIVKPSGVIPCPWK